jgi:uncharacterized damage-inducible protein DinB
MKAEILQSNAKYGAKVDALLQHLLKIPEDALNRRPAEHGWSAAQTAWHLIMVEELSYNYVQKKLGFGGSFEKVGLGVHWRSLLLKITLNMPLKFRAPAMSGDNLPAYSTHAEIRERWQQNREKWTDFLAQMPEALVDKAVYKHPRAGRLGWLQMLSFFSVHFERHRWQIERALRAAGA